MTKITDNLTPQALRSFTEDRISFMNLESLLDEMKSAGVHAAQLKTERSQRDRISISEHIDITFDRSVDPFSILDGIVTMRSIVGNGDDWTIGQTQMSARKALPVVAKGCLSAKVPGWAQDGAEAKVLILTGDAATSQMDGAHINYRSEAVIDGTQVMASRNRFMSGVDPMLAFEEADAALESKNGLWFAVDDEPKAAAASSLCETQVTSSATDPDSPHALASGAKWFALLDTSSDGVRVANAIVCARPVGGDPVELENAEFIVGYLGGTWDQYSSDIEALVASEGLCLDATLSRSRIRSSLSEEGMSL